MRIAVPIAALTSIAACTAVPRRNPPAPSPDPQSRAIAGLNEAQTALRELRTELGVSGQVEATAFDELKHATQCVGAELQALSQRVRKSAPAVASAAAAAPSATVEQTPSARETARVWTDEMRALGDGAAERREKTIAALRASLGGSDAQAQLAALMTLQAVGDVQYDKASFRPLVLPFARDGSGPTLQSALYALYNTAREPQDLALVHAAWQRDPKALHDSILHLMTIFGDRTLEGRSEEIAIEWLSTYRGGNSGINGMWGARVGPRLEARVIELARSPNHEVRHAAIYFGLSTFDQKSAAVVEELIATLTDPDHNNWGRALWGLGHGVPDEQKPRVVAALIELHNSRSDPQTRASCARTVEKYGGDEAAAKLAR